MKILEGKKEHMKIITFLVLFLLAGVLSLHANIAPVVSDVTAQQRDDGSMKVDIYYDVYDADGDAMTIFMQVSEDDGVTWDVSCNLVSGDEGTGIYSGNNKHIEWNVGSEHPNMQGDDFRFKITAIDGGTSTCIDIDGNVYQTIVIGDQEWMAENLKVTHYRNGDSIPNVTSNSTWAGLSTGAYCYYDNDPSNADTYGALYNWYAVDDSRELAPVGWHVPTDTEIMELEMHLGMSSSQANSTDWRGTNEGSKLAGGSDLWIVGALRNDPEFGSSGFDFIPGGKRYSSNGGFGNMGSFGRFWSSTEGGSYGAWNRLLLYDTAAVHRSSSYEQDGFSVRCVRD